MALSYQDSADLMQDPVFLSRVKVACLNFAVYIGNEDITVPAHNTRLRWAQNTMMAPDVAANNVAPSVVMDPTVQAEGSAVSDSELQTATESALNKLM